MQLRDVLSRADRTLTEARQARGEVLAKIAASEVPAVSGPSTALHEQLSAAADYRRRVAVAPSVAAAGQSGGARARTNSTGPGSR